MHHDRRIPSNVGADSSLEEFIAREGGLLLRWDGVHVIGDAQIWKGDVLLVCVLEQREHQITSAISPAMADQRVERLVPFGGLIRVGIDELGDVEVLDRIRLVRVHVHAPMLPPSSPQREIGACDPRQELRDALSKCGLLLLERRAH